MNNILHRLSARDRKIVIWSVPVILILMVLLGLKLLASERQQLKDEMDRALEDIAWLQAQQPSMPQLRRECRPFPMSGGTLNRTAAKYNVSISREQGDSGREQLTITAGHGNQVIAWLRELECHGATVEELTLETLDAQGAVKGRVVLQLPVT